MKTNKLYKYINLLLRITIGFGAVWFIYIKLKNDFLIQFHQINTDEISYFLIFIAIILMLLNWGIEAYKWRFAIRKIERISLFKSIKLIFTGITMGLLTPNRVGEIPARALLLNNKSFKDLTLKTLVASFSQLLITLFIGITGLIVIYNQFNFGISIRIIGDFLMVLLMFLLLFYFNVGKFEMWMNKIKFVREKKLFKALSEFSFVELVTLLCLSFVRYMVFSFQFWLVLLALNIPLMNLNEISLIPVCFLLASLIPTILISEIGVRSSVALFVFGTILDMDVQIILASLLLWLINVALPALIGLTMIGRVKIFKEE